MTIFYAAVEGDPLDSGKESRVISAVQFAGTIEGDDGFARKMAFIGDHAWCEACKSFGVIARGASVRAGGRMVDFVNGGRYQAVGGDEVVCKCARHPRIIAVYGRSWTITNEGDGANAASLRIAQSKPLVHDEQFTLRDQITGDPLHGVRYRITSSCGQVLTGETDSTGRTQRVVTDGAQHFRLDVIHK